MANSIRNYTIVTIQSNLMRGAWMVEKTDFMCPNDG